MKKNFILALVIALGSSFAANAQCSGSKNHQSKSTSHHVSNSGSDLVEVAASNSNFETLVVALKAANLVPALHADGPFTVFAPVNSAFAKLPDGTVETLLKPENKEQLTKILTYHVVSGKFSAKDVMAAVKAAGGEYQLETLSGDILTASIKGSTLILTDENGNVSAVTQADVDATNGVIHVIDSVVLPS